MAIFKANTIDIDLNNGNVCRTFAHSPVGEADILADRFGVRVLRNGQAAELSGVSVTGMFIRADGTTVALNGGRSGNYCYCTLPASCYTVEGKFTLSIRISDGATTATVRIVDGSVVNTAKGTLVDPGGVIPDVSSLTALVTRAEAAAAAIEANTITATQITGTRYRIELTLAS